MKNYKQKYNFKDTCKKSKIFFLRFGNKNRILPCVSIQSKKEEKLCWINILNIESTKPALTRKLLLE